MSFRDPYEISEENPTAPWPLLLCVQTPLRALRRGLRRIGARVVRLRVRIGARVASRRRPLVACGRSLIRPIVFPVSARVRTLVKWCGCASVGVIRGL